MLWSQKISVDQIEGGDYSRELFQWIKLKVLWSQSDLWLHKTFSLIHWNNWILIVIGSEVICISLASQNLQFDPLKQFLLKLPKRYGKILEFSSRHWGNHSNCMERHFQKLHVSMETFPTYLLDTLSRTMTPLSTPFPFCSTWSTIFVSETFLAPVPLFWLISFLLVLLHYNSTLHDSHQHFWLVSRYYSLPHYSFLNSWKIAKQGKEISMNFPQDLLTS